MNLVVSCARNAIDSPASVVERCVLIVNMMRCTVRRTNQLIVCAQNVKMGVPFAELVYVKNIRVYARIAEVSFVQLNCVERLSMIIIKIVDVHFVVQTPVL